MKGIGILPELRISYIDHLVPLCQLLQFPILVTEPWIQELIELYYPPMEIILADSDDYCLDAYLEGYNFFVYVDFFRKTGAAFEFGDYITHQKARSLFSFHGNSDKNWDIFWIERLLDEDLLLLYGPQQARWLEKKEVRKSHLLAGNYRLEFYRQHEAFFDARLPFEKRRKILLYAPTWSSPQRKSELSFYYSSFFEKHCSLFRAPPSEIQLIVKLHPHQLRLMRNEIEALQKSYPHIYFLDDFPLIYPLLKEVDFYLGDYSSIGYDFLAFDRPLFFFELERPSPLAQAGRVIKEEELPLIYEIILSEKGEARSGVRQGLYAEAFGEKKALQLLKREIEMHAH
jgi:CDP-glycerol glycerophosphotransferase (TagB/SpsB family)